MKTIRLNNNDMIFSEIVEIIKEILIKLKIWKIFKI